MATYEKVVLIGVNYNTSRLVNNYVYSWRMALPEIVIIIVDSYSSNAERLNIEELSKELSFTLVRAENNGYSSGLLKGLNIAATHYPDYIVLAGNIDVLCVSADMPLSIDEGVVPCVRIVDSTGKLASSFVSTEIERKLDFLADLAASSKSQIILVIVLALWKLLRIMRPFSNPWSPHGCLFVLTPDLLDHRSLLFSDKLFLYCEEYLYGVQLRKLGYNILSKIDIKCIHISGASTEAIKSSKSYIGIWANSWLNSRIIAKQSQKA